VQGIASAQALKQAGVPVTVVLDAAAAYVMERVDLVLVGAEGVVENGGIVNKLGTYGLALAAKALGKPVYVAAESFKMVRLYPLNQRDLPEAEQPVDFGQALPNGVDVLNPIRDYTPPDLLTLLVTDLGLLTPAAVSDMLISLHAR
jgi:translation initiation factor eIF-2B subunit alpha